ncbi:MAG: HAD family hydrolase [Promethearchaeota archaeon]
MSALVSDFDGTLLDVRKRFTKALVTTLHSLGIDVSFNQLMEIYQVSLNVEDLMKVLDIELSPEDLEHYAIRIDDEFYANWRHSRMIPGVVDTLKAIQPKLKLMRLITSRRRIRETQLEVRYFGIEHIFNKVLTRGHLALAEGVNEIPLYPFQSHRQRLIQLALSDVKNYGTVWVLGDTSRELEAGKTLGFKTIGVLTGFAKREDLEPFADYILDSAAELDQVIK